MKIVFDAGPLYSQKTGIGHYTYNLIKEISTQNIDNEIILFSRRSYKKSKKKQIDDINLTGTNIDYVFQPLPNRIYRATRKIFGFPHMETFTGQVDIAHGTNFLPLPSGRSKTVVTIHDCSFMVFPEYASKDTLRVLTKKIPRIIHEVDVILTDSNHARKEVIEIFDAPENKVNVVYAAASEIYRPLEQFNKNDIQNAFSKGFPYILYVGTIEPRKNISCLIKAFNLYKKNTGDPIKLVISGRLGWLYEDITTEVERSKFKNDIIFSGYVSNDDMPKLYNGAELFVYPSFYEGFGMPPLEAMQCGVPVITSNCSALPEVVGEAAILIDPEDYVNLATQIEKVLCSSKLRKVMVENGLKQANKFSWAKSAKICLDIYSNL